MIGLICDTSGTATSRKLECTKRRDRFNNCVTVTVEKSSKERLWPVAARGAHRNALSPNRANRVDRRTVIVAVSQSVP